MSDVPGEFVTHLFSANRKFDPRCSESWTSYIKWSGLHHVHEIVSTDPMLCPSLIESLVEDDWGFNIHGDNRCYFFHDVDYLKNRISYDRLQHNILALTEQPTQTPSAINGFEFCGYDILDSYDSISVLLNCGGFPEVFETSDHNQFGLLDDLDKAMKIAQKIRETCPNEPHCTDCCVWGIARFCDRIACEPNPARC